MKDDKAGRRRGAALEAAILDAAWAELVERSYADLTLEAVAKRAGTSRPVLHRRWPSRGKLAAAAVVRHLSLNPIAIPDLGGVRDEMNLMLRRMSDRARPDMIRLVFDMQKDLADSQSSFTKLKAQVTESGVVQTILARGIARGEIDPARLTPRIVSLPADLARHEILMTFQPLPDETIRQIVDEIFLPLVRRTARPSASEKANSSSVNEIVPDPGANS